LILQIKHALLVHAVKLRLRALTLLRTLARYSTYTLHYSVCTQGMDFFSLPSHALA
jgi:hypothetical protein